MNDVVIINHYRPNKLILYANARRLSIAFFDFL